MESPARNASLLQEHIEELRRQSGTGSFSLKGRADPEYFAHAQSISDLFRSLKPLAQQDRERPPAAFPSRACISGKPRPSA